MGRGSQSADGKENARWGLIIRDDAEADIEDVFGWYETRSVGLGTRFMQALDEAFTALRFMPEMYPAVHQSLRRVLLNRFPYVVYHRIDGESVEIVGVLHAKREPSSWQRRR